MPLAIVDLHKNTLIRWTSCQSESSYVTFTLLVSTKGRTKIGNDLEILLKLFSFKFLTVKQRKASNKTYAVGCSSELCPVRAGELKDLDGLVPPVLDDELSDVGGGGGGEDSSDFHFSCSSL